MTALTRAIADLVAGIPKPGASVASRIAYFIRKADVLEQVAAEHPEHATEATELAAAARAEADQLGAHSGRGAGLSPKGGES